MSEEKKDREDEPQTIEDHLREALRRANVSFAFAPMPGPRPEERREATAQEAPAERLKKVREFSLKPRDIRDYLDRFVIRQDEAKKVLSVAVCDHYNHVRRCLEDASFGGREYAKHNIILLGPTGVGKTYLVRCIARLVGVPFVKADATKFSETGYVGRDVEDLVRDLVKAADGDTDWAQYGIIYLDEVDKIASAPAEAGRDVSGRGVQVNLLKLMEETDVGLFSQTDLLGQMQAVFEMQRGRASGKRTISTRHILFIVSGAFDRLGELVQRRLASGAIGFAAQAGPGRTETDVLRQVQTRDLVQYGFEPEFVGRLPVRVVCEPLAVDDLEQILLKSEDNVLGQYRSDFAGYGIELRVTPEAIRRVAEKAHAEGTGARGLMTVLERVVRDFKFELPSTPVRALEVTADTVDNSAASLAEVLRDKDAWKREGAKREVERYAAEFAAATGIVLAFSREAVVLVAEMCERQGRDALTFCREWFRDLEYGLKLIARNTGASSFTVTKRLVADPSKELSRWVADSFRQEG